MRWSIVLLLGGLILVTGCTPLEREDEVDLVPLTAIPAEYGELESVTLIPEPNGPPEWYELWFYNEDTGQVTYVPVHRHRWKYAPTLVKIFERTAAPVSAGGEQ